MQQCGTWLNNSETLLRRCQIRLPIVTHSVDAIPESVAIEDWIEPAQFRPRLDVVVFATDLQKLFCVMPKLVVREGRAPKSWRRDLRELNALAESGSGKRPHCVLSGSPLGNALHSAAAVFERDSGITDGVITGHEQSSDFLHERIDGDGSQCRVRDRFVSPRCVGLGPAGV